MSIDAKPMTTAEVESLPAHVDEDGPFEHHVLVERDELLATTRALETEIARVASIAADFDELSSGYLARAEKAERQLDCGEAGPVCAAPAPGCLRHNLEYQRELEDHGTKAQLVAARSNASEWQALAEAAQADVERLVREKAELVASLKSKKYELSVVPDLRAGSFNAGIDAALEVLAKWGG